MLIRRIIILILPSGFFTVVAMSLTLWLLASASNNIFFSAVPLLSAPFIGGISLLHLLYVAVDVQPSCIALKQFDRLTSRKKADGVVNLAVTKSTKYPVSGDLSAVPHLPHSTS